MRPTDQEAAKHARRAAALLVHYANNDREGFGAILSELEDVGDGSHLILGLCGMFDSALPMLLTPQGLSLVRSVLTSLAEVEYRDPS